VESSTYAALSHGRASSVLLDVRSCRWWVRGWVWNLGVGGGVGWLAHCWVSEGSDSFYLLLVGAVPWMRGGGLVCELVLAPDVLGVWFVNSGREHLVAIRESTLPCVPCRHRSWSCPVVWGGVGVVCGWWCVGWLCSGFCKSFVVVFLVECL
jgi:hypothetical protein